MRGREFIMKDGYSFDLDEAGAQKTYRIMFEAYSRIFKRCGLKFRPVEAMTGAIGGSLSHEFQVLAQSGEDPVLTCTHCDYAANIEKARVRFTLDSAEISKKAGKPQKVSTPNLTTVDDVAAFLKTQPEKLAKILIYDTEKGPIAALLRGDHELVEAKLQAVSGAQRLEKAGVATIEGGLKSAVGFSGPVGLTLPIYADFAVTELKDFITGANEVDAHLTGVNLGDFATEGFFDLRRVWAGDPCPQCNEGKYEEHRGIEVGQVFYLGTKYSSSMKAVYKDEKGEEKLMVMGCYGIGVSRTAAAAIEQNHDANGMVWPYPLAPYHFHLISLNPADAAVAGASREIYQKCSLAGLEILWDDREESPGVKFKDSDLIGIPFRVVVGAKGLKDGVVEIKERDTGEMQKVALDQVVDYLIDLDAAEQVLTLGEG
jgi:prolyl-tRNA synthetase